MRFHKLLRILFLSLSFTLNSIISRAKPGPECSNKCGNITIPYPFGIEENCYLGKQYKVSCNETTGRVAISRMNVDVVDISLDGHLRAKSRVGRVCFNQTTELFLDESRTMLSRFPISRLQNMFITLGCDTESYVKDGAHEYRVICSTLRGDCLPMVSCSISNPINCCQKIIETKNLMDFHFLLRSAEGHVGKKGYTSCSYAFIVEGGRYDFSMLDVYNLTKERLGSYEMLLDWTVGNTKCQEAKNKTGGYLCKENSECFDSENADGYSCKCSVGYQGNPYLEHGCQDVNECDDPDLSDCIHACHNTVGNYTCECPKGHSGDGRKKGTGCKKNMRNLQKLGLYIGIGTAVLVTSLTMFLSYCLLQQRRIAKQKEAIFKRNGGTIFEKLLSECKGSTQIVKIFTEEELKKATNNFNQNNIIGQGGFGTVYKGIMLDNTVVAIKKSKVIDPTQIGQFVNEVVLLSQIDHPNIVKLVGCCIETDVPLLAYEYIVNETLHHHLHGSSHGALLTWRMRLKLAVETAGALAYMHSTTNIIHRDIKSSNILLTNDYTVKVSDFGISRSVPKDKSQVSTAIQGTLGYIDPEYFSTGILTEKSDVYSFGVLLVEMLTGEKVNSPEAVRRNRFLVEDFVFSLNEDQLLEILDKQVKLDSTPDQLYRVAHLVKSCVGREGKARPTMQEVKEKLLDVQANLV